MSDRPSILFVNQHYAPDLSPTSEHLSDLAEHLADEGFEVHVLCARGMSLSGGSDLPAKETRNGVHVHRVRTTQLGRGYDLGRLVDFGIFYLKALRHLLVGPNFSAGPKYDLVVTLTTPPLLCVAGAIAAEVRGQRFGIWSIDLHPEAEQVVDLLEMRSETSRFLHRLKNWGHRAADFTVAVGCMMERRLRRKYVPFTNLRRIPLWSRTDEVRPIDRKNNPLAKTLNLKDSFVVTYVGYAGLAHRFEDVLNAAADLDGEEDILFLFVGIGPKRTVVDRFVEQHELDNVQYRDPFPTHRLAQVLSLADVHLVTLRKEMAGITVPGVFYGMMASGRPVLFVGHRKSELGHTIESENVGRVVDPWREADPGQSIRDILLTLKGDPQLRERLGDRARNLVLKQFEKEVCCETWTDLIEDTLAGSTP